MGNRLVTVKAFPNAVAAHAARIHLEDAGISAYVADENMIGLTPILSDVLGGVKVQVNSEDLAAAREVLAKITPADDEE